MTMHVRHFVSQRFGKSTVTVEFSDDMAGVVAIAPPCPDQEMIVYTFDAQRVAQMIGDPLQRPERLMRIAIGQAHKQFAHKGGDGLFGVTLALEISTAPWIGDLTEARYGGATQGYDHDQNTIELPALN